MLKVLDTAVLIKVERKYTGVVRELSLPVLQYTRFLQPAMFSVNSLQLLIFGEKQVKLEKAKR